MSPRERIDEEDVALGQRIFSGAELQHVVAAREGQLARQLPVEGYLEAPASLEPSVARTVGRITRDAEAAAQLKVVVRPPSCMRNPSRRLKACHLVEVGPMPMYFVFQ